MAHHIDRVQGLLTAVIAFLLHGGDAVHHFLGDLVSAFGPCIDHLIVFFELGDEAIVVLLLKLKHHLVSPPDDLCFGIGDLHVVLAERDAGPKGLVEPESHDLVAEDDRLLLTAVTVDGIDHGGDCLLS